MNSSDINLIVQISGKRTSSLERLSLGSNGLTLGRAWNSDILIQDKYVDAAHLELISDPQGVVTIRDLGSTNGSMLSNQALSEQAHNYHWGDEIRVGDTTIRIFDQAQDVDKTANRSHWYSLQKYLESKRALAVIAFLAVVISTMSEWAFSPAPLNTPDLLVHMVTVLVILLVWTLIFASIGKLIQGQSNMRAHLGLVSLVVIALVLLSMLIGIVLFNLQSPTLAQWLSAGLYGAIFIVFIYALMTYTTHFGSRAKWIGSVLLVGGTLVTINSDSFLKEQHELWSDRSNSEKTTLPPALMWRQPVTLEQYLADTDGLFDQVSDQD